MHRPSEVLDDGTPDASANTLARHLAERDLAVAAGPASWAPRSKTAIH